jgi:hypothetical protein
VKRRSTSKPSVPPRAPAIGVDFAGSSSRRSARIAAEHQLGTGGDRRRGVAEMQAGWAARGGGLEVSTRSNPTRSVPHRIAGANGSLPGSALPPRPPPLLVLYEDLVDPKDLGPAPVYGQYPRGLIRKALPWLRCQRHQVLHICSGSLPRGEGTRVDVRPEARPDVLADARALPFAAGSWRGGILIDPPYSAHYARELYGVDYPRPSHLLREAARVAAPGVRIGIVHYITPKPVPGTFFVKAFAVSTGFDMPMRALSFYERDASAPPQVELALEAST